MIMCRILTPVFLGIIFIHNIMSQNISNDDVIVNYIKKIETIIKSQDFNNDEKRNILLTQFFDDKVLQKLLINEIIEMEFKNKKFPIKNQFTCLNYSVNGSGTNINNLTPGDINVVAALGDSLTAGLGIGSTSILNIIFHSEEKGKVFDIGGIKDAQTLPNFLKIYNPNIKGFSKKKFSSYDEIDGLNVAKCGATSKDIMSQVETLIELLKNSEDFNMKNDWKLINIFIGNNDICRSCEERNADSFTPKLFKERLIKALDKLKEEVPRAFVSLITMLDVYEVNNLNVGLICSTAHLVVCPCVAYSSDIKSVIKVTDEFQNMITEIEESGRYDGKDDFTVVTQPFFKKTNIPYINDAPDLSYFAPDCFHFNEKGHGQIALSLWNSLFEPITSKRTKWHVGEKFECPSTKKPYLATKNNNPKTSV